MDEEETIYNLIPKPPPVIVKGPLHRSQFDGVTGFCTATKRAHGTMGLTKEQLKIAPENFLKKGSRCKGLGAAPEVKPHGNETLKKPPVPTAKETAKAPQQSKVKRNYILENWKSAPKTKQLHPQPKETFYTEKKDYGKVPKYLNRVKKEAAEEAAYWDEVRESMMPEDTETRCRLLTEEERLEILNGLQANLADVKKRYGAMSFGQDHMSFRKRKEAMEAEMAQLEADITTFSRQNVYITEN